MEGAPCICQADPAKAHLQPKPRLAAHAPHPPARVVQVPVDEPLAAAPGPGHKAEQAPVVSIGPLVAPNGPSVPGEVGFPCQVWVEDSHDSGNRNIAVELRPFEGFGPGRSYNHVLRTSCRCL